jgi:hypothetical protein
MYLTAIRASAAFAILLSFTCGASVIAAPLPPPNGDVLLTVDGEITNTNTGTTAEFALADLEAIAQVSLKTSTPWTTGVTTFEGVPLSTLLKTVGASGARIDAAALNDYAVSLPIADENGVDPLIAYKINGAYIPIREKGPLWIIYPFDENTRLQSEVYYARAIWHLDRLAVKP